jgi:hypothetical protein
VAWSGGGREASGTRAGRRAGARALPRAESRPAQGAAGARPAGDVLLHPCVARAADSLHRRPRACRRPPRPRKPRPHAAGWGAVQGRARSALARARRRGGDRRADLLDVRVAQLESGSEPPLAGVSTAALLLSLVGIAALTAAFVATVLGVGGPDAVARETGASLQPTDVALALLCAVPWVIGGFAAYRWLDRRAKRPLTRPSRSTTRPS